MSTFRDWNYFNRNVQSGLTEGQFLTSSGTCLFAGPPVLVAPVDGGGDSFVEGDTVYPLGTISGFNVNQQPALIPIAEMGSQRTYTVVGPTSGQFGFQKSMFHGPSILRALYASFSSRNQTDTYAVESLLGDDGADLARLLLSPKAKIWEPAGYENFFINMASDLFMQPMGVMLYIRDSNNETYGACYMEQCHVAQHGLSTGPGQVVLSENVACMYSRIRPIKVNSAVPLMSRAGDSGITTVAGTENTTGPGGPQRLDRPFGTNL